MDDDGSIQIISITETAAKKVFSHLEKRGKGIGIRVGVQTTGCSGLAYKLEFVDVQNDDDVVYESNNIKIFVDKKSLPFVLGMEMDWVKQGLNEGFDFKNPQEKNRCGCGESFTV